MKIGEMMQIHGTSKRDYYELIISVNDATIHKNITDSEELIEIAESMQHAVNSIVRHYEQIQEKKKYETI